MTELDNEEIEPTVEILPAIQAQGGVKKIGVSSQGAPQPPKPPKKPRGSDRKGKFCIEAACEFASRGLFNAEIHRALGITRQSYNEQLRRKPKFKLLIDQARVEGLDTVLTELTYAVQGGDVRAMAVYLRWHGQRDDARKEDERESAAEHTIEGVQKMSTADKRAMLSELIEKANKVVSK